MGIMDKVANRRLIVIGYGELVIPEGKNLVTNSVVLKEGRGVYM